MTGKTHRAGGMLCCFIGYSILQQKGYLVKGISPLLQATVMYPFALWGSTLPDLDHNADSIPSKDIISVAINRILHLQTKGRVMKEKLTGKSMKDKPFNPSLIFDARHRSWQTHSDLFLIIFLGILHYLTNQAVQTLDTKVLYMVVMGITLGIISHMILDLLTPEGIWSILCIFLNKTTKLKLPEKIHIVPKSSFFATDGPWEKIVMFVLWFMNSLYILYLIYLISPYKITFDFIN